ncbi:helix-turn-helix domain-containing protein [Streptomyces thermolilacinus]
MCCPSLDSCADPLSVPYSRKPPPILPTQPSSFANYAAPLELEVIAHPASRCHEGDSKGSRPSLLASTWYSTKDLATRLRIDASTLRRWRTAQPPQGPPFVSVSERVVMYSAADVEEWLHSRRITPRPAA